MAEQRTRTYRVTLGGLLTLHIECLINEPVALHSRPGGPVEVVTLPGTVVAVSATYDMDSAENNLRVHRIARAFGVEAVVWDAIPEKLPEPPPE